MEVAATYYPSVDGGPRVEKSGYGFAFNIGLGFTSHRVHGSLARGFEIAAARYEDTTGKGSVGHLSPWAARVDYAAKHLAGKLWFALTAGGTWGKGAAAVEYDEGVVSNMMEGANNPKVTASTWSAMVGPTLQVDGGKEFDFFMTVAPTTMHSSSAAFDPFSATGVTFRMQFMIGPDPGPMNWGTGVGTLFRRGYNTEEEQERFKRDQADFNRRQDQLKDQERERQDRERQEKERECQQSDKC
jgi:hypothetical protein